MDVILYNKIAKINAKIGEEELYEKEKALDSTSEYYKDFSLLKKDIKYILKVTAHTSGTYTLASSTQLSSSTIVDTVATSVSFSADTPVFIPYTPTADVRYLRLWVCDNWEVSLCESKTIWDAIEGCEAVINDAFVKTENKNRIDESKIIPDKYYNSNGVLADTTQGWVTTGPIPITANEKVYFSVDNNGTREATGMYFVALFSSNGTLLDYSNGGSSNYTAQYSGIMHFSWKPGTTKVKPFCGAVPSANYYDEYGYTYNAKGSKPYNGVIWACVGDSMTEANSCAKKHYFDYIAEEFGFIPMNYGVGGTGYAADMANNRAFFQRIPNISEPFDVLTIFGSVNDLSSGLNLGTYEDTGTTTIGGCINTTLDAFYTLAPFKKIGIISQPPSVGTANNGHLVGTNAEAYTELLEQICKNRGIPFLDLFHCSGLKPWDSDYREEYYNEDGVQDTGVHPNSKGQKQLATKIREFIKTVI